MNLYEDTVSLVNAYLNGVEDGEFDNSYFKDGSFYTKTTIFAKRASNGDIVLGAGKEVTDEINDAFIIGLARNGNKFKRIFNFNNLLSPNARLADLREGKTDDLTLVSRVYGFDMPEFDTSLYALRESVAQKISEMEAMVIDFFTLKRKEEADKANKIQMASVERSERENTIKWDAFDPSVKTMDGRVKGIDGGTRLRYNVCHSRIESSTSNKVSINTFRTAYNKVAPYVFGTKASTLSNYQTSLYDRGEFLDAGHIRDHGVRFSNKNVSMGCQSVTHAELKRIAIILGWPLDGSPATV